MQKSTSTNGRRVAAAMFLGATSAAMVAGTAHADGVTGAKFDTTGPGGAIAMSGDHEGGSNAVLIGMKAPGSSHDLWTYCIQKTVELNTHESYDEHAWSEETKTTGIDNQHLAGIKWILNNSVPQLDAGQLSAASGVAGLDDNEAVEGTQAAIWNLSDASGKTYLDTGKERDAKVIALYKYLTATAKNHMNDNDAPKASLSLVPASTAAVHPGATVKFTIGKTTASAVSVTLTDAAKTGAKLVDADGKAFSAKTEFKSGDTVYVQVPSSVPAGSVKLTASGVVSGIEAGRVFVTADGKASQNLILAQAQSTPVTATAELAWTAAPATAPSSSPSTAPSTTPSTVATTPSTTPSSPAGGLAHTGAGDTVPLAAGALALVAAGGGMVLYTRRTRKQGSHF